MSTKIIAHFKKADPILYQALLQINDNSIFVLKRSSDYFEGLCDIISNQQLSTKAADTIFGRFKKLYPGGKITPEYTLKLKDDQIRKVGMSRSKVNFIKNLAQKIVDQEIDLKTIEKLENEAVKEFLTKLKGIGPWSAEMFLMFHLGRENIFSHGDLGLRNAIKKLYKFKKEPTKKQIDKLVKKWTPYETYACRILWRSLSL